MAKTKVFFYGILFILISHVHAQKDKIRFEKLTIEQGLSQNSVISICQDHEGFLWFGTYDGLNRYDGYQFKIFINDAKDSTSLIQNAVRDIYEDSYNVLWIGTEEGLCKYSNEKENFTNFVTDVHNPKSISNNRIRKIYEDKNRVLWISTENGLNKFDRERNTFKRYYRDLKNPNTISDNFVRTTYEDSKGNFWIGTESGLDLFDREKETFKHFKHEPGNTNSLSESIITRICEDKHGFLWFGTRYGGLNRFDYKNKSFVRYVFDTSDPNSLSYNTIRDIYEDRDGDLWIVTNGGGLEKYDRQNDRFIHYQKDFYDPFSLSSNALQCIYEDRSGIIWIGTDFGGVNKFDKRKNQFIYFGNNSNFSRIVNTNSIISLYEDPKDSGNTIWIGTWGGGLAHYNRIKDSFRFFRSNPQNNFSLSNDIIRCITKDKFGILWIGTDKGLNSFNPVTEKFTRYLNIPNDTKSLSHNMIKQVFEDSDGDLWICTNGGGLDLFDRNDNSFIHFKHDPQNPNSINDNIVWFILQDKDGLFWLGTNSGGLNSFNKKTRKFTHYMKNSKSNSISENKVLTLMEDSKGNLWIGTAGGGINKFDKSKNIFKGFTEKDGLVSNTIHAIVEDDQNNLWISTTQGLSKFDLKTNKFINYNSRDGLQSDEFHVNSYCKSITGEIFLGGINGFNIFRPEKIKVNNYKAPVIITDFYLFNKHVSVGKLNDGRKILEESISETKSITLNYYDEVFSFQFAILDFTSPERNMYAFKMEGFDNEWNYVGNRNFATYTRLPPGKYVFRVKGSNHNGVWSEEGVSLAITIIPPFWKTLWFNLIVVIFLAVSVITGYKLRTAMLNKRNKLLEQSVVERTEQLETANKELEAFTYSVSHDLRAPLRAINGYSKIFLEEYAGSFDEEAKRLLEVVRTNSSKMGNLINDLLNFSRISRAEVRKQIVDMNKLVQSVVGEIKLTYKFNQNISIGNLPDAFCDQTLIKQVWSNLISNAIKFSLPKNKPKIEIGTIENNNEVVYFVKDNGVGFNQKYVDKIFSVFQRLHKDDEYEGTGIGLAIVHKIIKKHNGKIWAEAEENTGASFYFLLKTGK